jgi:Glutathione S-transferase, C-terminal domain
LQLAAHGQPYLMGAEACIADFSVAHCLWYVRRGGAVADIITRHPHVAAWLARVLAFGHGKPESLTSTDAIAVAARGARVAVSVQAGLGFEAGQAVTVTPIDYGMDPVAGSLVGLTGDEVVLARHDERAGLVHVHFPRHGFQIKQE